MVIYTYTKPSLFLLALLTKFSELLDGLIGVLTFGLVHSSIHYRFFMKLYKDELAMRAKDKRDYHREEWPRLQIWPRKHNFWRKKK